MATTVEIMINFLRDLGMLIEDFLSVMVSNLIHPPHIQAETLSLFYKPLFSFFHTFQNDPVGTKISHE